MFATGYVRVRYLLPIMALRMLLASFALVFVAAFIWPLISLG